MVSTVFTDEEKKRWMQNTLMIIDGKLLLVPARENENCFLDLENNASI